MGCPTFPMRAILAADATYQATGASAYVGHAPKGSRKHSVLALISETPTNTVDGEHPARRARIQVDHYAREYIEARDMLQAARKAFAAERFGSHAVAGVTYRISSLREESTSFVDDEPDDGGAAWLTRFTHDYIITIQEI